LEKFSVDDLDDKLIIYARVKVKEGQLLHFAIDGKTGIYLNYFTSNYEALYSEGHCFF